MMILSMLGSIGTPSPKKKPPFAMPSPPVALVPASSTILHGHETMENAHTIALSLPFTDDNAVNFAPNLMEFITHLQICDKNARIVSNNKSVADITKANKVPKNAKIKSYINNLQSDAVRKCFKFYFTIMSALTFSKIKYGPDMFGWLKAKCYYILHHGMVTKDITSLGFILSMHAMYSNRDEMKTYLNLYLDTIEYTLVPVNQFFIKDGECTNVRIVEVQVNVKKIDIACDKVAGAFMDPTLLETATHGDSQAPLTSSPASNEE